MSENEEFIPLSPELGIQGSSYRLQMGKVGKYWAIRLVKGKDVLDSKVWKESEEIPNGNRLTGWVLSVLAIPNINPYQIQKTVGFVRQKAIRNWEDFERRKKKEQEEGKTKEKKEKAKEEEKLVKKVQEEAKKPAASKPSKVSANAAMASSATQEKTVSATTGGMIKDKKLKPIPRGGGSASSITPSKAPKEEPSLASRIEQLEKKVEKLTKENEELKQRIKALEEKNS